MSIAHYGGTLGNRSERSGAGRKKTGFDRRRDPEARRGRVLDVALRMFRDRGYEATSVNEVAREAGVSVGALYKYFPDKPALLEGALDRMEGDFAAGLSAMHDMPGSQLDKLHTMMVGLFDMAAERHYFYWTLTSGTHALSRERERRSGDAVLAEIRRFIADGVEKGDFRSVDVEVMATLGFGVVETAMKHCFGPSEGGRRRDVWARNVEEMLARCVRP